jgi:hypothetical protein
MFLHTKEIVADPQAIYLASTETEAEIQSRAKHFPHDKHKTRKNI